jgi:hypothetical protein
MAAARVANTRRPPLLSAGRAHGEADEGFACS